MRKAVIAHYKGETDRLAHEYRHRHADGTWHWALTHGIALKNEAGRVYRVVGSTGDVTDRKAAEEALREALEQQTATAEVLQVINSSPGALPEQNPRRSRTNLRPRSRSAWVIDRLLKDQNPLENRNNLQSSSPHPGPGQTSGEPRRNFGGPKFIDKGAMAVPKQKPRRAIHLAKIAHLPLPQCTNQRALPHYEPDLT